MARVALVSQLGNNLLSATSATKASGDWATITMKKSRVVSGTDEYRLILKNSVYFVDAVHSISRALVTPAVAETRDVMDSAHTIEKQTRATAKILGTGLTDAR